MKATGIVRRIDDLGRVVIPKEIRRTLKIREGMPMEIFTDASGEVILKKYSVVGEMSRVAEGYVETLVSLTGFGAIICDTEQVIAIAGPVRKEIMNRQVSEQMEELMHQKRNFRAEDDKTLLIAKDFPAAALAVYPVVSMGDAMGAVILQKSDKSPAKISTEAVESLRTAAMFLSRQLEE
jgi:looped-hinge helix DNA binding domain, AbrB family